MLTVVYMMTVLGITIFSRKPRGYYSYNLELFWSYKLAVRGHFFYIREVLLNILLFVPEGVLVSLLLKKYRKSIWFAIVIGLLFSAGIELAQFYWQLGYAELDDVFSNTLGTLIGVFFVFNSQKKGGYQRE